MKISHKFPVLRKASSLLVVTGTQAGKIYRIANGELSERDTIEIQNPEYTDREGYFEQRGNGKVYGSGAVYETNIDQYVHTKFLNKLVESLQSVQRPYNDIYLFAPQYAINSIEQALTHDILEKVRRVFAGNYIHHHPQELLEKIKERRQEHAAVLAQNRVGGEAKHILQNLSEFEQ